MFSAIGNILPGSISRPDIATIMTTRDSNLPSDKEALPCKWNMLGYIPVVSTFTGCGRALLGVAHVIIHLSKAVFDSENRSQHLEEAKLGVRNIVRGICEMVPIVGNVALFFKDALTIYEQSQIADEYKRKHQEECNNQLILFINGQKVGQKSFDEMIEIASTAGYTDKNRPAFWETVNLIQSNS
jgi:hypothetical protein